MEVTVISREMIKPSTPTPPHLEHLNLSLLDQHIVSSIHVRILLVYSSGGDVSRFQDTNMSHWLKSSLSEVLTDFYPFAGTFNGNNRWIDCNDSGVEYVEARVKEPRSLEQLLACPHAEELDRLVPHDAYAYGTGFKGLSAVQVTVFEECGSVAVGLSVSHVLTDASSLAVFVDSWARIARGGEKRMPTFDFASIIPPRDIPAPTMGEHDPTLEVKKLVVRRFVFPQSKIDALKAAFEHHRPTKVEVLSALVFKCLIKLENSSPPKPIFAGIAMNLRGRASPPLPMDNVGNMIFPLMIERATPEMSLNDLGKQLRELIKAVDGEYVGKLLADDASLVLETFKELYKLLFSGSRLFQVTSWCRFPFNETDFGWGGPAWMAPLYMRNQDCCVLVDAMNGDGVEAWMILDEEDMARFASDSELLEFACPSPI